jgi:hypothetical protein
MAAATASFGEIHFGRAQLGDERRRKRLVRLADRIVQHPEGTLPDKLQDPAAYQAMYRLCRSPEVTHEAVLQPHRALTLEKMRQCDETVLVLHDTTELDYTSITSLRDQLGPIGDGGGRGYECHNSLAVLASSGEILGLANQILHHRAEAPKDEPVAVKREREDRESLLWLKGSQAVGAAPAPCQWVDICDRGADTFEFLDFEDSAGKSYVVRSCHNRAVWLGHGGHGDKALLHDHLRSLEALGGRLVEVPGRAGQAARRAKCLVSLAAVRLVPPHVKRGKHRRGPLLVWAIRIWEIEAPAGVEPLEWFLLSNVPTRTLEEAVARILWYERRWIIEEYHKAKKTGCGIEQLQFTHAERLEPMVALLSVVAMALVNLRVANRSAQAEVTPARQFVPATYVAVLSVWRFKQRRTDLSVREFTLALARLGGHQNRRSDGPPGWLTLWRGWNKLQQMIEYAVNAGMEM